MSTTRGRAKNRKLLAMAQRCRLSVSQLLSSAYIMFWSTSDAEKVLDLYAKGTAFLWTVDAFSSLCRTSTPLPNAGSKARSTTTSTVSTSMASASMWIAAFTSVDSSGHLNDGGGGSGGASNGATATEPGSIRWGFSAASLLHEVSEAAPWRQVKLFDWREIEGADIARDWWILGVEAVK